MPAPTEEVITPESVAVTAGAETVRVRAAAPRVTAPPNVRLFVLAVPPKVKSRLTVIGLAPTTMAALPARIVSGTVFAVALSPIVKAPPVVPKAVALARMSVPSWSFHPPVFRLALLSAKTPLPSLVIGVVTVAAIPAVGLMLRSGVTLEMKAPLASLLVILIIGEAAPKAKAPVPEMVATVAAL